MKTVENQKPSLPALFAEIGKKVAVYLVIVLFFNGLVAYITYSQLETSTKTFGFDSGNFLVNGGVMGIPLFSLVNFVLLTAAVGSAVLNWTRKVRS